MLLADPYARKKSRTPSKNRVWNFFGTSAHFTGDLSSKTQCSQWEKPESATTTASEHSYFALYEAYGTRPYEWGSDPDRQKANTKEEESDLGLLNEGMRYRDLETGTFLSRDPIGYMDGPNVYCYVHCNPITRFDAFGLDDGDTQEDLQDQMDYVDEQIQEVQDDVDEARQDFKDVVENDDSTNGQIRRAQERLVDTLMDAAEKLNGQNGLNQQRADLSQSMADLKASGWDREGVKGDGTPVAGGMMVGNIPGHGSARREATDAEKSSLFKTDANGQLVPKTNDDKRMEMGQIVGSNHKPLSDIIKAETFLVTTAMGAGPTVNGIKAATPAVKAGLTAVGNYYLQNAPQINQKSVDVINGVFGSGSPHTPPSRTQRAAEFGSGVQSWLENR
jgi:RHS repeat-associated protein